MQEYIQKWNLGSESNSSNNNHGFNNNHYDLDKSWMYEDIFFGGDFLGGAKGDSSDEIPGFGTHNTSNDIDNIEKENDKQRPN